MKPSAVIRPLGKNLRAALYQRLAGSGVLSAEQGKILGVFPAHRWPAQDVGHEAQVRQTITEVLVQQTEADPRTAALIALVHALRCEHKIAEPGQGGLSKRQLRARAEEIAKGNWASQAVRKVAIGLWIAAIARSMSAASLIGNLLFIPMLFLSGMFFPRERMGPVLRDIGDWTPLGAGLACGHGSHRGVPLPAPLRCRAKPVPVIPVDSGQRTPTWH